MSIPIYIIATLLCLDLGFLAGMRLSRALLSNRKLPRAQAPGGLVPPEPQIISKQASTHSHNPKPHRSTPWLAHHIVEFQ